MTTTLARRVRRIGFLPTTYKTVKEEVLRKDEHGKEVAVSHMKHIPVRHHDRMSNDTHQAIVLAFRADAKAKRLAAKARQTTQRHEAKARSRAKALSK